MKAITLTQPYAALVELHAKRIETRSWSTWYRGPLAIHAAKGLAPVGGKRGLCDLAWSQPFASVLFPGWRDADDDDTVRAFDYGAIVATCELIEVVRTEDMIRSGKWWRLWNGEIQEWPLTDQELAFGDYSGRRYAWLLANIQALPEPIPAKGALSLWEWVL